MHSERPTWREVEPTVEIVPTEREEAERRPTRAHDEFWMWNTEPGKVPAKKEESN